MKKENKTLVIHPKDPRTFFMSSIYLNKDNCDVYNNTTYAKEEIIDLLSKYDRIVLLGTGNSHGLYDGTRENFLIDESFYPYLENKEVISMWEYSDVFMRRGWAKGFHTGKLIYEFKDEVELLGIKQYDQATLYSNINHLCNLLSECIDLKPLEIKKYLLKNYDADDEITNFNRRRLKYYKELRILGKTLEEIEKIELKEEEDRKKKEISKELIKKQDEEEYEKRTRTYYFMRIYLPNDDKSSYSYGSVDKEDLLTNCKYLDYFENKNYLIEVSYLSASSEKIEIKDNVEDALKQALAYFSNELIESLIKKERDNTVSEFAKL